MPKAPRRSQRLQRKIVVDPLVQQAFQRTLESTPWKLADLVAIYQTAKFLHGIFNNVEIHFTLHGQIKPYRVNSLGQWEKIYNSYRDWPRIEFTDTMEWVRNNSELATKPAALFMLLVINDHYKLAEDICHDYDLQREDLILAAVQLNGSALAWEFFQKYLSNADYFVHYIPHLQPPFVSDWVINKLKIVCFWEKFSRGRTCQFIQRAIQTGSLLALRIILSQINCNRNLFIFQMKEYRCAKGFGNVANTINYISQHEWRKIPELTELQGIFNSILPPEENTWERYVKHCFSND